MATPRSILSHCSLLKTLNKSLRTSLESKFPLISSVLLVWKKVTISRARLISQQIMYFWYKTGHFRITPSPRFKTRLQNSRFFFHQKSVKKSVKRGVRVAREPHTLEGRVRRERKNDCPFSIQWVRSEPGGSKMSSSCQKSVHNSTLFMNLIHSVIDFEGE